MARFPGTETHLNKAGFRPGDAVRCRRSSANASLGLADRRGLVAEVRPGNVRVLLDLSGAGEWLPNESLLPTDELSDETLAALGRAALALGAQSLTVEDDELVVSCEGFDAAALDEARALLGERLRHCSLAAEGVHRMAVRLGLTSGGANGGAGGGSGAQS
jgi:hypothetical protein